MIARSTACGVSPRDRNGRHHVNRHLRIRHASLLLVTSALAACVQDVNLGALDGAPTDSRTTTDAPVPTDSAVANDGVSRDDASTDALEIDTGIDASTSDVTAMTPDVPSRPDASWPDAIVADAPPVMPGVETARTMLTGNLTRPAYTSDDRTMFAWLAIGGRSERDLYSIDTITGTANLLLPSVTIDTNTIQEPPLGDRVIRFSTPRMVGAANGWVSVFFDTVNRREIVAGLPQDFRTPGLVHDGSLYVAVSTAAERAEDTLFGTRYRYRRQLRRYALDSGAMTGSYELPWGFFDSFAIWQQQGATLYLAPAWQCPVMPGAPCTARIDPAPFIRVNLATMTATPISTLPTAPATFAGASGTELFFTQSRELRARDAMTGADRVLLAAPSNPLESNSIQVAPDGSRALVGETVTTPGMVGRLRELRLYLASTRMLVRLPSVLGDATASVDLATGAELSQAVFRNDRTTELWFIVRGSASSYSWVVADFDASGGLVRSRGFSQTTESPSYQSNRSSILRSPDGLREFVLRREVATGFVRVYSAPTGSPNSAFVAITSIAADHSALGAPSNDRVTFLVRDPARGFVQLFARGL